jgi:thioesterase domain-containing protein
MTDTPYDTDFYQWTQAQAAHLRAKEWSALDVDNLAEEIESLGASDRRALRSHLMRLSQHLLKWRYQPQRRGESWQQRIDNARLHIELILEDSPSLREFLPKAFAWAYPRVRKEAAKETGLPLETFPETCPWSLDQLQDEDFLPEAGEP